MNCKKGTTETSSAFGAERERAKKKAEIRSQLPFYILLLIPVIDFLIFRYWPMFGLALAFQDYKIGSPFIGPGIKWVGFKWFSKLVNSPNFGRWVRNTLLLSLYSMLISIPMSVFLAVLLNEIRNSRFRKLTSNITLLPHFISTVVIVGMLFNLFSVDGGVINQILIKLGHEKIDFMGRPEWFRTMYIGSGLWQSTGFSAVVYTAAIAGIDPALYEAAAIDGSSRFQNIFRLTIPCIMPTIITMVLLRLGGLMSSGYEKIILMYTPATYETADTLGTYAYRAGILDNKMSLSTAVGLFNSVCNLVLLMSSNWLTRKISDTSLF